MRGLRPAGVPPPRVSLPSYNHESIKMLRDALESEGNLAPQHRGARVISFTDPIKKSTMSAISAVS